MENNKEITWPERPTSHDTEPMSKQFGETNWRGPRKDDGGPYAETFRTCSYCGSIHPGDLVAALESGATMSGSDWKYGWPHKFYIELPNPKAGQDCRMGSGPNGPIVGQAPAKSPAKFYTQHLTELSSEAFDALAPLLEKHTGIKWSRDENGIKWQAPHVGYQR